MEKITVQTTVNTPVAKAWEYFTNPEHVTKWNHASDDWHSPKAENDLRVGGTFAYRMEAKDGSVGFDFGGTYDAVEDGKSFSYTMDDGRTVSVTFESDGEHTTVTESFDPENENPIEMQRAGWQSILDTYKKCVEQGA